MLRLKYKFLALFCSVLFFYANATHNRAGEITYKRIAPFTKDIGGGIIVQVYTYSITVIKYTDDGPNIADRCVDTIYFGDNTRGIAPRVNGPTGPTGNCDCGNYNGVPVGCGVLIISESGPGNGYKVKQNIYTIIHTYPGAGEYLIRTFDPNRNQGVHNIPNSVNQPFYIESKLIINSLTGANSSPVFTFAPIDRACVNICFEHNPGAYDPDGDSLSYEITTSRGEGGHTIAGYFFPETGPGGTFGINSRTGLLRWCRPQLTQEYNIAFIVKEWRKNTSGVYQLIGYVLRDMQVIVKVCPTNLPPSIAVPDKICVEAGKTVTANLIVSDPNHGDVVTVQGGGGPFSGPSPVATFSPQSGTTFTSSGSSFPVFFSWQTTCDHIRSQEHQANFKVQDNGSPVRLAAFNSFNIRVVPPAVTGVTAEPAGTTMKVSWSPSSCSPANNALTGYKVYRKENCTPYTPNPCEPGVPASNGFALIGETTTTVSSLIDNNNGNGLVVGQDYSYLVVAVYKDGTETFGSTQVCAKLKRDVPIILNVDVDSTSVPDGEVWIRWTRPLTSAGNLDTVALPGPYQFILKHRTGSSGDYTPIFTSSNDLLLKLDTQYRHKSINTTLNNEEYIIEFISGTVAIGSTQRATSVFLSATPSDRKIGLNWTSTTPWDNYKYTVMRKDSTGPNFVLIGTTTLTSYTDNNNIVNGSTYCYYIIAEGSYSDPTVFRPLINKSQQSCVKAKDLTPPVAPTITIEADCPTGFVKVNWTDIKNIPGSDDVYKYVLYYKPTIDDSYKEIATSLHNEPLSFVYDDLNSISGCYAVLAIDKNANTGPLSPDFCIDNCPEFELPNIFTPNDDGTNDFYKAIKVRQIKEIDLAIVDRWGHVVYTTKDPYFKWDGVSIISKAKVSEGTFFYVCDVFETRLKGPVKRTLKGYLQVVR